MNKNPKLLFFTFAFPPSRAIGAVRCWNIARHLARRGWEVEVVTPDAVLLASPDPGIHVASRCREEKIRLRPTDCNGRLLLGGWLRLRWWEPKLLSKIARRVVSMAGIDPTIGWVSAATRACGALVPGSVDMVFVSGPPYTAFTVAAKVAQRLRVPLILDYRDLWSQNPHYRELANSKVRRQEMELLAAARGVTAVSPSMAECLRNEFRLSLPVTTITNGYDASEFETIVPEVFDDFAIVYAGRFYPPGRTAQPLIAAVARANVGNSKKRPIRLHYYGPDQAHVNQLAVSLGATQWVKNHGVIPRAKVLAALKGASAAAVITTVEAKASPAEQGILTGKLFEAMGAQVPILLISPERSDASKLIHENGLGAAFSGTDVESMSAWLVRHNNTDKNSEARVGSHPFEWPQLSEKLDHFLRQFIGHEDPLKAGSLKVSMSLAGETVINP
jgi:glycosyltransferase involved in cell wall biosynthesis